MNEPTRHEILEERGNRDAFRICVLLVILLALLIGVLGIAAWNSRFMLMPIVPRNAPAIQTGRTNFNSEATKPRTIDRHSVRSPGFLASGFHPLSAAWSPRSSRVGGNKPRRPDSRPAAVQFRGRA